MSRLIAVHESEKSDRVIKFINQDSLNEETSNLIENGNLYGLYYNENGEIVAEDIWGDIHEIVVE
jgi:hypothetical protein